MVSVLVPVYNKSQKELTRCFESILNQTCKDFELIITDDGSKLEVAAFLDEYTQANKSRCAGGVYCYHYPNGGVWIARNRGQEKASGEWIIHINADDKISHVTVESALKAVDENDNVDMVYWGFWRAEWRSYVYKGYGGNRLYLNPKEETFDIPQDILCATPFCDVTCMVRSVKSQNFNPDLIGAEFEHQVRVIANCRAICFIDAPLYNYFSSDHTITSKVDIRWCIAVIKDSKDALIAHGFHTTDEYLFIYAVDVVYRLLECDYSLYKSLDKSVVSEVLHSKPINKINHMTRKMKIICTLLKSRQFFMLGIILRLSQLLKKSKLNKQAEITKNGGQNKNMNATQIEGGATEETASLDCAVVISTCDKYSDIWEPFFTLFHKFWPDNPYPVFLNTESIDCNNNNVYVTTLKARSAELSWTRRLKEALERVDAEYIIFMLDDFFIYDFVDTTRIEECLAHMRKDANIAGITFYDLSYLTESCDLPGLEKCKDTEKGKINSILTLWRRNDFLFYLDHDESAWEFEANSLERSRVRSHTFYAFSQNTRIPIPYNFTKYGLFAGKWFKPTVDLFKEHGIEQDFSDRGFYEEYEFGLIPYVASQIKLDSFVVPCYSLTRDNPRVDTDAIVEEGRFFQSYDVSGATNVVMWYPSSYYGYAIDEFKCIITFKDGTTKEQKAEDVNGSFSLYQGAMCFFTPGAFVYIIPGFSKEMLRISIEGYLNKQMDMDTRAAAYSMEVRVVSPGISEILSGSRIYVENLLVSQRFVSFRMYSNLCIKHKKGIDCEHLLYDGKDRFPGPFKQTYKINQSARASVRWNIGATFGGFAIENLQVDMTYCDGTVRSLDSSGIKGRGILKGKYRVFLENGSHLDFLLPEPLPDEISISGNLMAPMPSKVLRSVMYADELTNSESSEAEKAEKTKKSLLNLNILRFFISIVKRAVKKYGFFGVVKEAARRVFRR